MPDLNLVDDVKAQGRGIVGKRNGNRTVIWVRLALVRRCLLISQDELWVNRILQEICALVDVRL